MSYPIESLASDPHAALELGKAAEYLVCADLLLSGYRCFPSDQGLPYDVLVDLGPRMLRVQVKGTCAARDMNATGRAPRVGYTFHVRRRGKGGAKRLDAGDCDIVALAALDIRLVAYLPIREVGQCCQLMPPGHVFAGKYKRSRIQSISDLPFRQALERFLCTSKD